MVCKYRGLANERTFVIPVSGPGADSGKIIYSKYPSRYKTHTGDTVLTVAKTLVWPRTVCVGWNKLKGNDLRQVEFLTILQAAGSWRSDPRQ